MTIATALSLKDQGKPLPGSVIALSPWLDMENKGETLVTNDATDALISVGLLEGMIAGVLGDQTSPTAPLANPLYADYSGFPRLYITAGGAESLLDNATRLNDLAEAAGVDVTLSVVEAQQHVFPFNAGRTAAADDQIAAILDAGERFADSNRAGGTAKQTIAGRIVFNLFYENSTRTLMSFSVAAHRLGAQVVTLPVEYSSAKKGETLDDTARTLNAMRPDALVGREA